MRGTGQADHDLHQLHNPLAEVIDMIQVFRPTHARVRDPRR